MLTARKCLPQAAVHPPSFHPRTRHTQPNRTEPGCTQGLHYAATLRQWDARFVAAKPKPVELGYDERFFRMWRYYLCYSEAGFAARFLSVYQVRFTKPFASDRPDEHIDNPIFGVSRRAQAVTTTA